MTAAKRPALRLVKPSTLSDAEREFIRWCAREAIRQHRAKKLAEASTPLPRVGSRR